MSDVLFKDADAVRELATRVATRLNKLDGKYGFDPATILTIIQIIIKLVSWYLEWRDVQKSQLSFLQRAQIWFIIRLSGVKGVDYSEIVDAIFEELNKESFNAVKNWKSV